MQEGYVDLTTDSLKGHLSQQLPGGGTANQPGENNRSCSLLWLYPKAWHSWEVRRLSAATGKY